MNRLEKLWKGALMLLLLGTVITFTNCDDDEGEPDPTQTVYELLSADSDLSDLKGYVDQDQQLVDYLQGTTAYTLFAPDNGAFASLEVTLGSPLTSVNPAIVNQVMRFLFVGSEVLGSEIAGASIPTVQGESIVGNEDGTIFTGGTTENVEVLESDIRATNGRIHKVGTILIPPIAVYEPIQIHLGKLSQPILLGADFTTLAQAIAKADEFAAGAGVTTIASILVVVEEGVKYTMFAPSNGTFEAGGITVDTFEGQQWYGIIMNHLVGGYIAEADITAPSAMTSLLGGALTVLSLDAPTDPDLGILTGIVIDSNGDTTPEAQVAVGDAFEAANGVLHVIAGVLAPAN